jgi:hypothetical protein
MDALSSSCRALPGGRLDTAIVLIGRLRATECEARAAAIRAWGHSSRPRIALMVLDELRLILRMVRRYAPASYFDLIEVVLGADNATAVADAAAE